MTETHADFALWTPGVLIVDGSSRVRVIVGQRLLGRGFAVWRAACGREAVELYRRTAGIDLVLIDAGLPGMDGPRTLAALRAIDAGARCLFLTGEGDGRYGVEGLLDLGAELVVSKPLGLAELDRIVSEVIRPAAPSAWAVAG